jgi:serine/threonine protein kinase/CHASE2 domain-containing sensor protein
VKECPLCRACADDSAERCPEDGTRLETTIPGPRLLDGKYEVERRLGEGGMGVVYRGHHLNLHRGVAIKVIADPSEGFADRFRIEAAALGRLKHPHIVDVMDFGVDQARGIAYLVMELLEGVTLAGRCDASRLLGRSEALHILEQVAAGIDFAHDHHILHRDLKPSNIFLVRSHTAESVKILDFGLAQFLRPDPTDAPPDHRDVPTPQFATDPSANETTVLVAAHEPRSMDDTRGDLFALQDHERGLLMGTPAYMAPELLRFGPATPSSDLYSLGVLAYQLFTGLLPAPSTSPRNKNPPPSAASGRTPRELDAPIMRLLEHSPSRRPHSARAAIAAIAAGDRAATAREWRERERPRRGAAVGVIAALTALGATLWTVSPIDRIERAATDARFGMATPHPPNPAILLVVLDDASVDAEAKPLGLVADEFGSALSRVFDAGARAVGVDLLLPRTWSGSGPFAQLLARHADRLTLGAFSTDAGAVLGPECLPGLVAELLGSARARAVFGFVNLDADSDGVTRRVRLHYRDAEGRLQATWAARTALTAGASLTAERDRDSVDYTTDMTRFRRVSWRDVPRLADSAPEAFRDRIVLVGGEFAGSGDAHRPPPGRSAPERSVSGLVLQALILNTILDGFPIREPPHWPAIAGVSVVSGVLTFLVLMKRRLTPSLMLAASLVVAYVAAACWVFAAGRILWPVAGPVLSALLALGAALVVRASWGAPPEGMQQTS